MEVVIRKYSGKGAKELFDVLEERQADLEPLMRSVKGFVSYTLARSHDGGFAVTVCEDQAGIEESTQKAKDWVVKNATHAGAALPEVFDGSIFVDFR